MICRRFSLFLAQFGRPFVKRFALCYQSVVCLSACPVGNVGVLCPDGWMDQDETRHAGSPRLWPQCIRCVLIVTSASSIIPRSRTADTGCTVVLQIRRARLGICWDSFKHQYLQMGSVGICWGQTAGWIKLALGVEVGLIPADFVLDWDPAPPQKGGGVTQFPQKGDGTPNFRSTSIAAKRLHGLRCHLVRR